MASRIDADIKNTINLLKQIPSLFNRKDLQKDILIPAAKPLRDAARNNVAESDEIHFRYKPNKGGQKKGKGEGNIIGAYHPGNLKRAIVILKFRRSNAVFVGPRIKKGDAAFGEFKGVKVDGYYAAMVEYGTKNMAGQAYMRRALASQQSTVANKIKQGVKKKMDAFGLKNKI